MLRLLLCAAALVPALVLPTSPVGSADAVAVFRSRDEGRTWEPLASPPVASAFALLPDPHRSSRLYLATERSIWLSDDDGETWRQPSGPSADSLTYALAADPSRPGRLWAGTENGLLRSHDRGETWHAVSAEMTPVALIALPAGPGPRLYAGTADGLSLSLDGGDTWQAEGSGLDGAVLAMAVGPSDEMLVGTSTGLFRRGSDEEAFAPARGLPRGAARAVTILPDGTAYGAVGATLFRFRDGWTRLAKLPLAPSGDEPIIEAIVVRGDGTLLLGTDRGLHSSESWQLVPPSDVLGNLEIAALARAPDQLQTLYLAASYIPTAAGLAGVGVTVGPGEQETAGETLALVIGALFLAGGAVAARYLIHPGR